MTEDWLTIPFAPDYAVSDHGRVMRLTATMKTPANHLLAQQKRGARRQYAGVDLRFDGKRKAFYVHQLVALLFIGPRPSDKHEAAHGDGNSLHNHAVNLRWAVPTDNHADKVRHGTLAWGERSAHRLTAKQVREIRASKGSSYAIAPFYGVSPSQIRRVRTGENWSRLP